MQKLAIGPLLCLVLVFFGLIVVVVFLNGLLSPPCPPHYGPGHHPQRGLQLPQQVPAHHHDVQQCEHTHTRTCIHTRTRTCTCMHTHTVIKKVWNINGLQPEISQQFVEIKGSVFKKFEKNNLFQMSNSGECHSPLATHI